MLTQGVNSSKNMKAHVTEEREVTLAQVNFSFVFSPERGRSTEGRF